MMLIHCSPNFFFLFCQVLVLTIGARTNGTPMAKKQRVGYANTEMFSSGAANRCTVRSRAKITEANTSTRCLAHVQNLLKSEVLSAMQGLPASGSDDSHRFRLVNALDGEHYAIPEVVTHCQKTQSFKQSIVT